MACVGGGCGSGDAADVFAPSGGPTGGASTTGDTGASNAGGEGQGAQGSGGSGASGNAGGGSTGGESNGGGSTGGSGGAGPVDDIGCADGSREAYDDLSEEPDIAGCDGAFSVPGVTTPASQQPSCNREAGNDGANASGAGCSVADFCSKGWHVCEDMDDVAKNASEEACPEFPILADGAFYLTRQAQDEDGCAPSPATDNVVGCGNIGDLVLLEECEPLNRKLRNIECALNSAWNCGDNGSGEEAEDITKAGLTDGGVLCCRD